MAIFQHKVRKKGQEGFSWISRPFNMYNNMERARARVYKAQKKGAPS